MRKLWLLFAQAVTLTLAALFVVSLVKPDWLAWRSQVVEVRESLPAPVLAPATASRLSFSDAARRAIPAVVNISATREVKRRNPLLEDPAFQRFFGERFSLPNETQLSLGSGVIVSREGYILTNDHVVEGVSDIKVTLFDGRTVPGKIVGSDPDTDLAVVRINANGLTPITFGLSEQARVGDIVLAIGDPFSVGQTVTMGIISAKGRSTSVGDGGYEDFLQTDAPINHGNSGGALVNTKGELVGINSQILSNSDGNIGIGFAIPVNMAKNVMDQLRTKGRVTRAQLGVTVQGVTSEMAESLGLKQANGAIVSGVAPGSAAERAGVKRGDVIQSFNGVAVHDTNTLRNRVAEAGPGTANELVVIRDGSEKRLSVKLDEANPEKSARARDGEPETADNTALGVSVAPLTPELAARAKAPKETRGLFVEDVDPDGRAAAAGLQPGDIIQEVNRQAVTSIDDLRSAARKSADKPTLLLITRQGNDIFLTVRPANG